MRVSELVSGTYNKVRLSVENIKVDNYTTHES